VKGAVPEATTESSMKSPRVIVAGCGCVATPGGAQTVTVTGFESFAPHAFDTRAMYVVVTVGQTVIVVPPPDGVPLAVDQVTERGSLPAGTTVRSAE
jgi:hypothetical protein